MYVCMPLATLNSRPVHMYRLGFNHGNCGFGPPGDLTIVVPLFSCSQLLPSLSRFTTTTLAPPAVSMSHKLQYHLLERPDGTSRYCTHACSLYQTQIWGFEITKENQYLLLQSTVVGYFGRGGGVGTVSNCTCGGASRVKR